MQSYWTGEPVGFVDPQFDSAGAFLVGVYHHYRVRVSLFSLQLNSPELRDCADLISLSLSSLLS